SRCNQTGGRPACRVHVPGRRRMTPRTPTRRDADQRRAERCYSHGEEGPLVTISRADYLRLIEASESDDCIVHCTTCGAWLDTADAATATIEDFNGCWKAATGDPRYDQDCRSYRVSEDLFRGR